MSDMSTADRERLARVVRQPFYVYSPSQGGGHDYAPLIKAGLISVTDVGGEQETVLLVEATEAGRAALNKEGKSDG